MSYRSSALLTMVQLATMFGSDYGQREFRKIEWDYSPKISILRNRDELLARKKRRQKITRRKKKRGY